MSQMTSLVGFTNKTKQNKKSLFSLFIRNVIEMYVAKKLPHDVSVLPCDF